MMRIEIVIDAPEGGLRQLSASLAQPFWIGRDESADLVFDSEHVSRRHACLEAADAEASEAGILLRDRSANGTLLDGRLLHGSNARVRLPARLGIGPFALLLRVPEGVPAPALDHAREVGTRSVPVALRRQLQRALIEHLDLTRFDPSRAARDELRPKVIAALERICLELCAALPPQVRSALIRELCEEAVDFGPLTPLLEDPEVSEIMVVDPKTIYVERNGVIEESSCRFTDDEAARTVIERIVTPLGRRIDESSPVVDARLADGSRVHAVIAPLASRGTCITVRKFQASRPRLGDLVAWRSISQEMACLLERSVHLRKNIVISGGTGSGKTTLLNVLSAAIPSNERIVTIEDAAELRLQQKHVVGLEARSPNLEGKGAFPIRELVKNALRMRPDRIVVGECRGGEALDMLQAMNTGHEGSMTTTHANSPREACLRRRGYVAGL
jgi:pilus assembly protein CpaF